MSDEDNDDNDQTEPGSVNATSSLERNLVDGMTVISPGPAEADVTKADRAPSEQSGKTRQRDKQGEDGHTGRGKVHVGETTPHENKYDGSEWTTRTVHVGEDLGGVSLFTEGSEGTRTTINTRDTDGNDGDQNDNIHEAVKSLKTAIATDNDEG